MEEVGKAVVLFIAIMVMFLILAFPAMWIWNWALVPAVTIVKPITSVWQM